MVCALDVRDGFSRAIMLGVTSDLCLGGEWKGACATNLLSDIKCSKSLGLPHLVHS